MELKARLHEAAFEASVHGKGALTWGIFAEQGAVGE